MDEALDGRGQTHQNLLPSKQGLWEFIDNAAKRIEIEVLMPYGGYKDLQTIEKEDNIGYNAIKGDYPIEKAVVIFESSTGGYAEVVYQDNTLSVESDSPETYEFVLQRFERDAVGKD